MRQARLLWFCFHFFLIGTVSLHETLYLFIQRLTLFSKPSPQFWQTLDRAPSIMVGDSLDHKNFYRRSVLTYLNLAGAEIGYGYFAPNVSPAHALVFEWIDAKGGVTYEAPQTNSNEGELRLTSLSDEIGRTDYEPWRRELAQRLVRAAWPRHAGAVTARVFIGAVTSPTVAEFRAGKRYAVFQCGHVYELTRETALRKTP